MADLKKNIELLQEACRNPRAQMDRYLKEGKKIVGCFEPYTPEELVHASGMIPMGLFGGRADIQLATELSASVCMSGHAGKHGVWIKRYI